MRRAFLASAVVAGALLAAACSDQRSPLSTEPRVSPNFTASPCPRPVDLAVLIVQLFSPKDLLIFAAQMYNDINLKMSKGDVAGARKVVLAFVDFTLKAYYGGKLRDPNLTNPPTTQEAVLRLINGLLCWVGLPPTDLVLGSAGAPVFTKVIGPGGGELVAKDAAGNGYAGLKVAPGTVSEDRLWIITRLDDLAKSAHGCVTSTLRQFPLCIDYSVVPAQDVAQPVRVAQCYLEAYNTRGYDLRIAHQLTGNRIELLAKQPDPFEPTLKCEAVQFALGRFPPPGLGRIERAVWQLGTLVTRVFGPKPAYASHSGLGGLLGPKLSPVTAVQVKLEYLDQPSNTPPNSHITPPVRVAFMTVGRDGGDVIAPEVTNAIQVAIGTDPSESATLSGTTTRTPTEGIATFADLSIDKEATGYTLDADAIDSSFTVGLPLGIPVRSNTFDILSSAVLYGVNSSDDGLSTINVATGAVSFIGRLSASTDTFVTPVAMAVRPSDQTIFVWNNSDLAIDHQTTVTNGRLLTVNTCTGRATQVGPGPRGDLGALAFAPSGALFGLSDVLYSVNATTGELTQVGSPTRTFQVAGADFNGNGTLYAVTLGLGTDTLLTISTTTGQETVVGVLNVNGAPTDVGTVGSIVFAPNGTLIGSAFNSPLTNPRGDVLFDINPATAGVSNVRAVTGGMAPQGLGFARACRSP